MAYSLIGIDEPDTPDKQLDTFQRTISSEAVEDQIVLPGEHAVASWSAVASGISTATSTSHLIFIQADSTNYTRIQRIYVSQAALAGGAATAELQVLRTTTAGSGGTTVNGRPYDGADTNPYPGTIQTLPSSKGTEGVVLLNGRLGLVAAQPVNSLNRWEWSHNMHTKPIIIAPGTANGICLKIITGIATSTVDILVEFSQTSFL